MIYDFLNTVFYHSDIRSICIAETQMHTVAKIVDFDQKDKKMYLNNLFVWTSWESLRDIQFYMLRKMPL